MYNDTSFQNIKLIEASTFSDLNSVPFHLKFVSTNDSESCGQICFHLANAPLAEALVKAINDTLAAFASGGTK